MLGKYCHIYGAFITVKKVVIVFNVSCAGIGVIKLGLAGVRRY